MICFCTESAFLNEFAYFYYVIIMLILIIINNQIISVKYFHIIKYLLQNEFFLNKNVYLSKNYHIYNQNIYFDIILYIFLVIFNMQYFHYIVNSEILYIDFCHNYFLIWLIDCVFNHMLNYYYKINSNYMNF